MPPPSCGSNGQSVDSVTSSTAFVWHFSPCPARTLQARSPSSCYMLPATRNLSPSPDRLIRPISCVVVVSYDTDQLVQVALEAVCRRTETEKEKEEEKLCSGVAIFRPHEPAASVIELRPPPSRPSGLLLDLVARSPRPATPRREARKEAG